MVTCGGGPRVPTHLDRSRAGRLRSPRRSVGTRSGRGCYTYTLKQGSRKRATSTGERHYVRHALRAFVFIVIALSFSLTASEALAAPGTVLLFAPTNPKPGRTVLVTTHPAVTGCTPASRCPHGFGGPVIPIANFRGPAQVYLVPNSVAPQVRSVRDPRLIPIGVLRNGRFTFTASKLENAVYAAVVSCPSCTFAAHGRTLFAIGVGTDYSGLTPLMLLRPHGFQSATGNPIRPWVIGLIVAGAMLLLLAASRLARARQRSIEEATARTG
jgi:hypothetical protein